MSQTSSVTLSHSTCDCVYHIVFCPKYRKKIIFGQLKIHIGKILSKLLEELWVEKLEWNLRADHVHLVLRISPKFAVSNVVWALKWKAAIRIHNQFSKNRNKLTSKHFWSRWYFVRTTGLDLEIVRKYVQNQEQDDKQTDGNQQDFGF